MREEWQKNKTKQNKKQQQQQKTHKQVKGWSQLFLWLLWLEHSDSLTSGLSLLFL
jgi:hypothetical protein